MDRTKVLSEYWNLRKVLNKGNKTVNEATNLMFYIESTNGSEYRVIANLKGVVDGPKIELARRNRKGYWERSGYTSFKDLENYCALTLNKQEELEQNADEEMLNSKDFYLKSLGEFLQIKFKKLLVD